MNLAPLLSESCRQDRASVSRSSAQSSVKYGMPFAVATCPRCSEQFRLIWRIGNEKLPLTTIIRLACPSCTHGFEQTVVELTVFDAGREEFPKSVVVEESALKR